MSYKELIVDKLKESGDYYITTKFGDTKSLDIYESVLLERMQYIPEENLKKVYDNFNAVVESAKGKATEEFLAAAAKLGYLTFKPYVVKLPNDAAMLVLKYNRYVRLFRGQYYQVSYTADAFGEYQRASFRVDKIRQVFRSNDLSDSHLLKCLYYINLIQCCTGISAFDKLKNESPEVIDEFMKLSTDKLFKHYSVTYKGLMQEVCFVNKTEEMEPKKTYRIPCTETSDYARVNVYSTSTVGIEFMKDNTVCEALFTLPRLYTESEALEKIAQEWEMSVDEFTDYVNDELEEEKSIFGTLVVLALNSVGIITNFMVTYPFTTERKNQTLRALNKPDIIVLDNLNVIC